MVIRGVGLFNITLHPTTIEAYMLCWNGGSLKDFWTKNDSKVSKAVSYEEYHLVDVGLLPSTLDRIKAYQRN